MRKLTAREANFVREYLVDLCGKDAAIRAGYSARSAKAAAHRLLIHPVVAPAIAAAQKARVVSTGVTAERIICELARIAFGDIRNLFDDDGNLRPVKDLDADTAAALAGIEVTSRGSDDLPRSKEHERLTKARSWDKIRALELLGKHAGMFRDVMQHTGAVTFVVER